ncbi:MAG: hypothetical protein J6R06_05185 [Bacteroidales bacterium]|nr:hypothetical protein [Bacteroidales bacterium]MEE0899583.1 hypothetical protein [Bacteroidales bacterium]
MQAQNTKELFQSMNIQNKIWAVANAKTLTKALDISEKVLQTMDSLYQAKNFETNVEGSKYDAFRHVFWMYSLSSEIGKTKSRKIGVIYEDYNEYVFLTKPLSGYDFAGRTMDEYNNEVGLSLFDKIGKQEKEIVIENIKDLISKGYVKIIAKDKNQNSLDKEGNVIKEEEWKSNWKNNRYLINSNVNL